MSEPRSPSTAENRSTLQNLLQRVTELQPASPEARSQRPAVRSAPPKLHGFDPSLADLEIADPFVPKEPKSLRETGLSASDVEVLALKLLLNRWEASGRQIAEALALPFALIGDLLFRMKSDQLVAYRGSAPMNDYVYQLTDVGRDQARRFFDECSYYGAAPVTLRDYIASVKAQSIEGLQPTASDLKRAFADLLIAPEMLSRLGPAINSGRGMFLYGYPGNGKTCIAERVTAAFGSHIWIPRVIGIEGQIISLFDPNQHQAAPLKLPEASISRPQIDSRWVRIKRPTVIAGGELTMDNLEVAFNRLTGISEAPLQLKSNCGALVIDDFGRQKMRVDELLNRWIVPLEKRYDFLNLASGQKVQVPFDQLMVFSTNLEPKDLVDDAFLRRIPYKINVSDPTEEQFRKLFEIMCRTLKIPYKQEPIDYLIETHYKPLGRPYRCCQPRDLLLQIRNHCLYNDLPVELSADNFDFAVSTYFALM